MLTNQAMYVAVVYSFGEGARIRVADEFLQAKIFAAKSGEKLFSNHEWMLFVVKPGVDLHEIYDTLKLGGPHCVGVARHPYAACATAAVARNMGPGTRLEYNSVMSKCVRDLIEVDPTFVSRNALGAEEMIRIAREFAEEVMPAHTLYRNTDLVVY